MRKILLVFICHLSLISIVSAQWKSINNGLYGGIIQVLTVDPATNYIYAGTWGNGVFLSTNNGESWRAVNNGISGKGLYIASITISDTFIFAGTWGNGILLSTDNGSNWVAFNNGLSDSGLFVGTIAISGSNILAGTRAGVFLSNTSSSNWIAINNGLSGSGLTVNSIAISGSTIFIATNGGVFLSSDNGMSWVARNEGLLDRSLIVYRIVISGSDIIIGTAGNGIYLSKDYGNSWTAMNNGLSGDAMVVYNITINENNIFLGTQYGVFLSTNKCDSWTPLNNGISFKPLIVYTIISNGSYLFAGISGQGVYLSTNNGNSWTLVNNGLSGAGLPVGSIVSSGDNLFAGTQGSGVFLSTNNGKNWTSVNNGLTGGESLNILSLAVKGSNVFAGTGAGLFLSANNGGSWSAMNNGLSGDGLAIFSLAIRGNSIFAGTSSGIFLSTNDGSSWIGVSDGFSGNELNVNGFSFIENNIFTSTTGGIFLSEDNGYTWTPVNNGIRLFVTAMTPKGGNLFAGSDYGGVYRSTDNGTLWTELNNGFPNLGHVFVGSITTDGTNLFTGINGSGVYLSTDNGNNWVPWNDNLSHTNPYVSALIVKDLTIIGDNIFAGTQDGIWTRSLSEIKYLAVSADSLFSNALNSSAELNITSNTYWTLSSSESWITINNASGSGNDIITLEMQPNTSVTPRTAKVIVSGTGVMNQTIIVTQAGTSLYCSAGSTASKYEYISNVHLGSINQSSERGIGGYQDYTSEITTLQAGINATATINLTNTNLNDQLLVWADWNGDNDFTDSGENVYSSDGSIASPVTINITPPIGVTLGTTRMRIRLQDATDVPNNSPCGNSGFGEVEDYSINITPGISSYCAAGSIATEYEYISNVQIGSINQTSERGGGGYQDYTTEIINVQAGINTTGTISLTNYNVNDQLLIWVDWNKDNDFADSGEDVYSSVGPVSSPVTINITPPAGTPIGRTRMRIRLNDASDVSNETPCGNSGFGEVEDYSINVINCNASSPPTIGAILNTTCVAATGGVVLNSLPSSAWILTRTPGGNTNGTGSNATISGLYPGTYIFTITDAYGCSSVGSPIVIIDSPPTLPTVITSPVTDAYESTGKGGGSILSDGGSNVIEYGVCWSTSPDPTTENSKTSDSSSVVSFTSSLTGLIHDATYHIRAYAKNCSGTGYGSDITYIHNTTGVFDVQSDVIFLYPNPVSGILNIEYKNNNIQIIKILNSQGIILEKEKAISPRQQLNFSKYEPGLYILEFIKSEGEVKRVKVINQ